MKKVSHSSARQLAHKIAQPNRSSRETSCSEGMFTPVLGFKGPCCAASQDTTPPPKPSSLHPVLHQNGCCLRFGLGQTPQQFWSLSRPASPSLCSQDNQPRSAVIPLQFRVSGLLRPACLFQCHTWTSSSSRCRLGGGVTPLLCQWPIGRLGTRSSDHRALRTRPNPGRG